MSKPLVALLLLLLLALEARAETPSTTTGLGERPMVFLKAGRLLDVKTGKVRAGQGILIAGDRIIEVGPAESVHARAPTAEIIDLGGYTVLPGLIDCHAHVLGNPKDNAPAAGLRMSSPLAALWGYRNLGIWLAHGFTTLRDAGEDDLAYGQLALRNAIKQGLIKGPRIVSAGSFISLTGGHGDADPFAPDNALARRPNIANSVEQIPDAVRRDLKYGADWIKLMATGGVGDVLSDFNTAELSEAQMSKAVELAHRARRKVMAHAEGTDGIKAAVRAGVDSIEHGTMLDEEGARLMAERGTWLVPTIEIAQHAVAQGTTLGLDPIEVEKARSLVRYQQPAFKLALEHGVKIAYGVDDDPDFVSKEFPALVKAGMSPLAALQAATVRAAELLGMPDIGTIEPRQLADIVAVAGDPLEDIAVMEKVVFVMKGGEVFKRTF